MASTSEAGVQPRAKLSAIHCGQLPLKSVILAKGTFLLSLS